MENEGESNNHDGGSDVNMNLYSQRSKVRGQRGRFLHSTTYHRLSLLHSLHNSLLKPPEPSLVCCYCSGNFLDIHSLSQLFCLQVETEAMLLLQVSM